MHFVILGHMDPNDEAFWSGIPMNIVRTLEESGHAVETIGPLDPQVTFRSRVKGRFYRHVLGKVYLPNRDPAVLRVRAREANRLLKNHRRADAVLVAYPPDAAYLHRDVPLVMIHDATWHQLLDFYPGYERKRIARETQDGGYELDRLALRNCDRAIYSSRWAADSAVKDYGIDPGKLRVFPFGASIGPSAYRGELERWLQQRGRGACHLLFVGKEWHRKGGETAIAIAQVLHDQGMPVELHIVGCFPPDQTPGFVRSHGFLSKKNPEQARIVSDLFERADFFLLPTRADCSPLVLCEAAAYGLPALTTDIAAIPEIARNNVWALTLPISAPPEEFARWISANYADRDAYRRMANAARRDFEDRLNWNVFCRNLVATVGDINCDKQ